jgi:suppressor for copper-sensitivity B
MKYLLSLLALITTLMSPAHAGSSFDYTSDMITSRLITAEDGVAPDASSLSGGLVIEMKDGWKTYWKSPGQVGYPPTINWDASENIENVEFQWPAPKRFVAFDIENYGYKDAVTHPLKITLSDPGKAAKLRGSVSLLVCADICVPQDFDLALTVPQGTDIDLTSAALIADASGKVPTDGETAGISITSAVMSPTRDVLTVSLSSVAAMSAPNVFVDMGFDTAFGTPDLRLSGTTATVHLPILTIPDVTPDAEITVVDGTRAAVFSPDITIGATSSVASGLAWTLVLAFIGGLILNVMPCVLPVLSIKFASALKSTDQSLSRIRTGFMVSALGVLAFMWALAAILITIRATGGQVGWGIQFQSPVFLGVMVLIMTLFAANLAGVFEISLPQAWTTRMAKSGDSSGLTGDFATGALAAVMATPCSAPFLGTAVTVALAGSNFDTLAIFTALGAGLALPYVLVALRPSVIRRLPKPGAWMNVVKLVLAAMMAATGIWLLTVLTTVVGPVGAGLVLAGGIVAVLGITFATSSNLKMASLIAPIAALLIAPQFSPAPLVQVDDPVWSVFEASKITSAVADGQIVFVDVTAAWCLTCKANKTLVLEGAEVKARLASDEITAFQADWTRPDPDILAYLQSHGRFGIPFNIVYGPSAPEGIKLPEILTTDVVLTAFDKAGG